MEHYSALILVLQTWSNMAYMSAVYLHEAGAVAPGGGHDPPVPWRQHPSQPVHTPTYCKQKKHIIMNICM